MHALAISGSPRREGNTQMLVRRCLQRLEEKGISSEYVTLAGKTIRTCIACGTCSRTKDRTCSNKTDDFHPIFEAMQRARTSSSWARPCTLGLPRRSSCPCSIARGMCLAPTVTCSHERLGGRWLSHVAQAITSRTPNYVPGFTINDMFVAGSTYWNVALAREPGHVADDAEALATVDRFAENLAWMEKLFHADSLT